jgi:hypothetical protein
LSAPFSRAANALAHVAMLQKVLFEAADLLVEEIVCLVDKTERDTSHRKRSLPFGTRKAPDSFRAEL